MVQWEDPPVRKYRSSPIKGLYSEAMAEIQQYPGKTARLATMESAKKASIHVVSIRKQFPGYRYSVATLEDGTAGIWVTWPEEPLKPRAKRTVKPKAPSAKVTKRVRRTKAVTA